MDRDPSQWGKKRFLPEVVLFDMISEHFTSRIFRTNSDGDVLLVKWLLELNFEQAYQAAQEILTEPVDREEFLTCWIKTHEYYYSRDRNQPPRSGRKSPRSKRSTPNTATFGGYRLRSRPALNRDRKQASRPPKKRKRHS